MEKLMDVLPSPDFIITGGVALVTLLLFITLIVGLTLVRPRSARRATTRDREIDALRDTIGTLMRSKYGSLRGRKERE